MSSVDNRIVEMEVDNRNFEKGIKEAIKSLDSLTEALKLKDADKGFTSIESKAKKFDLSNMVDNVKHVSDSFSAMGVVGFTILQRLTNAAIDAGKKIASGLTQPLIEGGKKRALNIEQAKFQIEGLGYAWEEVKEDINYGVKDTAYGLDAAAKAASQLLASNVAIGDSMKAALRGISGVAAMTSSEYDDIARIFTTVAGNGRLMGDQLQQLSARGLNVAATLGSALGKTESEIRDMTSKGMIDFATFSKAMDDAFGEHAKKANDTFTGSLSNMKAALSRIGADFATPAYENLRNVMNSLTPVIDNIHKALQPLIDDFSVTIKGLAEFSTSLLKAFDVGIVSDFVNKFHILFGGLKSVVQSFYSYLVSFTKIVVDAFNNVFPQISDESVKKLSNGLVEFSKQLTIAKETGEGIRQTFENVFSIINNIGKVLSLIAKPFSASIDMIGKSVSSFANSINSIIGKIREFTDQVLDSNANSNHLKQTFFGLFSVARLFAAALDLAGKVMGVLFDNATSGSKSIENFSNVLSAVASVGTTFSQFVTNLVKKFESMEVVYRIAGTIQGAFNVVYTTATAVLKVLSIVADSFVESVQFVAPMADSMSKFIMSLLARFRNLVIQISQIDGVSEKLKNTFDGLFSIFRLAGAILEAVGSAFEALFDNITDGLNIADGVNNILSETSSKGQTFSKFIDGLIEKIRSFSDSLNDAIRNGTAFQTFLEKVSGLFTTIKEKIKDTITQILDMSSDMGNVAGVIGSIFSVLGENLGKAFDFIITNVGNFIQNLNFSDIIGVVNTGLLGGAVVLIKQFIDFIKGIPLVDTGKIVETITGTLESIGGAFDQFTESIKTAEIVAIAIAIGILAGSINVLGKLNPTQVLQGVTAITMLGAALEGMLYTMPNELKLQGVALALVGIGTAMLILSHAVENLGSMDLTSLAKGLGGVAVGLTELSLFLSKTDFSKGISPATGISLMLLAAALNVMTIAVEKFGSMDLETLAKGLISVGVALGEFAVFAHFTSGAENMVSIGAGILILSSALIVLSKAVESFGGMNFETLGKGFLSMAAGLGIIAAALNFMPPNTMSISAGLVLVGTAMLILSNALQNMGNMSIEQIAKGIATLAASLGLIAAALIFMQGTLSGSAALLVAAGALSVLAPVLILFGSMSLEQIGTSLLMLAGTFAVFGAAGILLGPVVPTLLGLSAAMALFGAGCLALGIGISAASTGLVVLAAAVSTSGGAIILIFQQLVQLIPFILEQIGLGLVALIGVIASSLDAIIQLVSTVIQSILTAVIANTPLIIQTGVTLITSFVQAVVELAPTLIQAGLDLIIAFLTGIRDNIWQIVTLAGEIMLNFINGITEQIPNLVAAGFNMVITFIESLSQTIQTEGERLRAAVGELVMTIIQFAIDTILGLVGAAGEAGTSFFQAVVDGISSLGGMLIDTAMSFISGALDGIVSFLGQFQQFGVNLVTFILNGLGSIGKNIANTLKNFVEDARQAVINIAGKFIQIGRNLVQGLIDGICEIGSRIASTISGFVGNAIDTAKNLLGIASPSKVFKQIGKYTGEGFIIGLDQMSKGVHKASENIGQSAIDGAKDGISKIDDFFNTDFDYSPKITPVIDMSDARNGVHDLDQMFTNGAYAKMAGFQTSARLSSSVNVTRKDEFDQERIISELQALREDVANLEMPELQADIYMDSKKVGSSLAPEMNKQLGILAKRGGLS